MTVATDAVFEMPEDGNNDGPRLSDNDARNITDPEAGQNAARVDDDNVPHPSLELGDADS